MERLSYQEAKQYKKVNAYTQKPCAHQIAAFFIFLLHLILHSVFVAPPIFVINNSILYLMLAVFYLSLILLIIDYLIITLSDPVDPLIKSDELFLKNRIKQRKHQINKVNQDNIRGQVVHETSNNPFTTKFCSICKRRSFATSYHCSRCNRCVHELDHHCKYLNNCIGKKNYYAFFRLLLSTTLYLLFSIGHCIWVLGSIQEFENSENNGQIMMWRWASIPILIYSVLILVSVESLLFFHCYINCIRKMSTIEYLFRNTPSNKDSTSSAQSLQSKSKTQI